MHKRTVLVLSTLCLAVSACETTKRVAEAIPTPANRLVCEAPATRPKVPPEYVIDWAHVATVPQAKAEHQRYVASIRTREGVVAAYVLQIEGELFVCFTNMQWRRDFESRLPRASTPPR
jgi:hypothetical protein